MIQLDTLFMNEVYHIPAMLNETIEGLNIKPGGVYVDVTFGGGGHSRAILERMDEMDKGQWTRDNGQGDDERGKRGEEERGKRKEEKGHLYSFDQDKDAYENVQRDEGQGTKDKGQGTKDKGQGTKEDGQGTKDNGQGTKGICLTNNPHWTFVHSNFRYLRNWMDYYGVSGIDGLLADLGVSFHHFDCPERGFSFRYSAPLDMRMNQTAKRTAADIVNSYSEEELAKVLYLYGEMKNSRAVARAICKARTQKPIERTEELVSIVQGRTIDNGQRTMDNGQKALVELEIPADAKKDLARLFQALRIEVNDELGALREMLVAAKDLLKPGGRIAVLTYHSLEDRLVKNFFRSGNLEGNIEKDFYGNILTPFEVIEKGREASPEEVERNPRSRSAKLRIAEKRN